MEQTNAGTEHRPAKDVTTQEVDPIGRALERLQTMFLWMEEHCSAFEKLRNTDPAAAETELRYLKDACEQGGVQLQRLTDLLLAGGSIDSAKSLPHGLCNKIWVDWIGFLQKGKRGQVDKVAPGR